MRLARERRRWNDKKGLDQKGKEEKIGKGGRGEEGRKMGEEGRKMREEGEGEVREWKRKGRKGGGGGERGGRVTLDT